MKVTPISKKQHLVKKINEFLKTRGYDLTGGSITEENEQDTLYIMIDTHSATTSSNLGKQMKELLGINRLVLNGLVY